MWCCGCGCMVEEDGATDRPNAYFEAPKELMMLERGETLSAKEVHCKASSTHESGGHKAAEPHEEQKDDPQLCFRPSDDSVEDTTVTKAAGWGPLRLHSIMGNACKALKRSCGSHAEALSPLSKEAQKCPAALSKTQ